MAAIVGHQSPQPLCTLWSRDLSLEEPLPPPLYLVSRMAAQRGLAALAPLLRSMRISRQTNASVRFLPGIQSVAFSASALRRNESETPAKVVLPGQTPLPPVAESHVTAPKYTPDTLPPRQDPLLHFLVNLLMKHGKKASAERYVADMLGHMAQLTHSDPLPLVYEAVELAKPILRMQSRKQGGKTAQVPIPLNARQSTRRALVWILEASRRRSDRAISRRLAVEMLAVLEGNSSVLSRKDEQHKVGMINRANASVRI